eukprot:SAG11_NODE_986_length_6284_cov_72.758771_8_plen_124_part_00
MDKAIAVKRARAAVFQRQAEAEANDKFFAKAVKTFDQALELGPANAECRDERDAAAKNAKAMALKAEGKTKLDVGEYEYAAGLFTEALHLAPYDKGSSPRHCTSHFTTKRSQRSRRGDEKGAA